MLSCSFSVIILAKLIPQLSDISVKNSGGDDLHDQMISPARKRKQIHFSTLINGHILVLPNAIGSSVGAYTIYSLRLNGTSPIAVVCTNRADITLSSGCAISNIPLVDRLDEMIASNLRSGLTISVDSDQEKVSIQTV